MFLGSLWSACFDLEGFGRFCIVLESLLSHFERFAKTLDHFEAYFDHVS